MQKSALLKLLALVLAMLMMTTLIVGCGGKVTDTSEFIEDSEEEEDFDDEGDIEYTGDDSSVSQQGSHEIGSKQTGGSKQLGDHKAATGGSAQGGLVYSENESVFENVPANLKGKEVIVASWSADDSDAIKVRQMFTSKTGIKVKNIQYNEAKYITDVATQIAAGSSPDIVTCNSTFPACLEITQPLPKIFDINDGFWDKRCSEATRVGKNYYYVNAINSHSTGGYAIYYNKKIYNNNGLTSPEDYYDQGNGHWSYEQLYTAMQDAAKLGYNGGILECLTLAGQMGVSLINYNQNTGEFSAQASNQDLIDALQYMAKAVDEGLAGGYGISSFASGRIGICMAGMWGTRSNGYFKDMSPSDIGIVPCPDQYKGKKLEYMPLGYNGVGIAKGARNPEAAYYWARWSRDLDKYDDAGANLYANKVLEKYVRGTQLVLFQNSKLYFEFYQGALNMIGKGWSSASEWSALRHASVSQVAVELAARENLLKSAAETSTKKLKEYTAAK